MVFDADVHQDLTSLSTGVMVLKKKFVNRIQFSFPGFWGAVNDIEEDLYHKVFGITSLKIVADNLNITDIQQQIIKAEASVKTLNKQIQ